DASAFAKGVITKTSTLHICYCHTPTRYLWSDTHQYINELKYNKYFKKIIALSLNKIRVWDRLAADRVDSFVANSEFIVKRIKKYYHRDSKIIYPPVNVNQFKIAEEIGDYFLVGGRLAPYKRVDLVVEAFNNLRFNQSKNLKLKIFGDGIDLKRLKEMAKNNNSIEFLGRITDEEMADFYSKCLAFINPQEEDFGITAVEAMAAGRPVIAYRSGGACETVLEGVTGEFFNKQNVSEIEEIIKNFDAKKYDPRIVRARALTFSTDRFKKEIGEFIKQEYENWNRH
ncbi:MAG: glycosyltransferase, partial [Candidatus Falkowbacteria bacterium]|nr:glycosyltransferase [Candidatus Falkowbacteria bacterium]